MKKNFRFEFKILAILSIVLVLVVITGIFAYFRFTNIVNKVDQASRTDLRLITVKSLMNNIREAENNAKSYSLTTDDSYLDKFFTAADKVNNNLSVLSELNETRDTSGLSMFEVDSVVGLKMGVLNELLLLQDKYRVQQALDKVSIQIERSSQNTVSTSETDQVEDSEKKRKFLDWFKTKKKKEEEAQEENQNQSSEQVVQVDKVSRQIRQIQQEELTIEQELIDEELSLISRDKELTSELVLLFNNFEAAELKGIEEAAKQAKRDVDQTNMQILVFCILAGGLLVFMTYIIINFVTNNNKYRKALRAANKEARELANAKEKFLANMSHELRTPMNAVVGFVDQLSKTSLDDEQLNQVSMIQKSANHLIYIINDVLDLTKLQNGKLQLEQVGFELPVVIDEVISIVKQLASSKGLEISCAIDEDVPKILVGDSFRLRQILLNLLGNSVKFTDYGRVQLEISKQRSDEAQVLLKLKVNDTGIGMSQEEINRIFNEFEQADESTAKNFGGTGLGLSITKMLIELHNGSISVQSEKGKGTTIDFTLPYKIGNEIDVKSQMDKLVVDSLQGTHVLIVDDEDYNRKLLVTILNKYNCTYREAVDGLEAVNLVKNESFGLILMDARMPVLDGVEATRQIRTLEDESKNSIPVIVLTAGVSDADMEEFYESGINGYVAKPFKERNLILEIKKVVESNDVNSMNGNQIVNFTSLKEMSGGDMVFYKDMLETFVKSTQEGVKTIQLAFENKDFFMMANQAHKISSPCRHLGANDLYRSLKELEEICRAKRVEVDTSGLVSKIKKQSAIVLLEVKEELKLSN